MYEVEELDDELMTEIRACQQAAAELLGVALNDEPKNIVSVLTEWTRGQKSTGKVPEEDAIVSLGVLLAEQYVRQYGWHWGEIIWDAEDSTTAVMPADRSLYINAIWWVSDVFSNRDATNFMLNFNMVGAGNVPQEGPNQFIGFH